MASYYSPQQMQLGLRTESGEPIHLGPYNHEQAPFLECSSCGSPITVGQRLVPDMTERILGITQSGVLVYVTPADQEGVAPVHSDCSAEYAHDQITKEPCEKDTEEENECEACGTDIPEGYRYCSLHWSNLGGR
jgi:predicted nucleic acid-binding Zn ribbon protein